MDGAGIEEEWGRWDEYLFQALTRIRGPSTISGSYLHNDHIDRQLFSLPVRMGGIGVLSHTECLPFARAAALDLSQTVLSRIYPAISPPASPVLPQRIACVAAFTSRRDLLLRQLTPSQRLWIEEQSTKLGGRWLSVLPLSSHFTMSDSQVSASLHLRMLPIAQVPVCVPCAGALDEGHVDVCRHHSRSRFMYRHEMVKHTLLYFTLLYFIKIRYSLSTQ